MIVAITTQRKLNLRPSKVYLVRDSFLSVRDDATRKFVFTTVPPGSIIRLIGELNPAGLVDIEYNGQVVAAFLRDILDRCDVVESSQQSPSGGNPSIAGNLRY